MDTREMFLVMGYGETPMPAIELVFTLDEAFNAVVRMVYGDPSPSELLEARADFCDFEERVRDDFEWQAEFEIGGIRAWKVCVADDLINALAAMSVQPSAVEQSASEAVDVPLRDLITYTPEHLTPDQRTRRLQEINTLAFAGIGGPGNRALVPAAKIEAQAAEAVPLPPAPKLDPYGFDVTLGERMYVDSSQHFQNGTVTLTLKRKPRDIAASADQREGG